MPGLLVVGSANMDLVVRTPRLPRPGETVMGRTFGTFPGGKGANQAVAAGMLGGLVAFSGAVGDDSFGRELLEGLLNAGVDVRFVRKIERTASGVASISVDDQGQNCIVVSPGANGQLTRADVRRAFDVVRPTVVLAQLEVPLEAVAEAMNLAQRAGAVAILNPAPAQDLPADMIANLDYITPNESELASLSQSAVEGHDAVARAARTLLDQGARNVVVTLGSEGAVHCSREGCWQYPPVAVQAVDTTAAGDAFNGALASFLAEGTPLEMAVRLANRAGAISATRPGAQASMPTREEVLRLGPAPTPSALG